MTDIEVLEVIENECVNRGDGHGDFTLELSEIPSQEWYIYFVDEYTKYIKSRNINVMVIPSENKLILPAVKLDEFETLHEAIKSIADKVNKMSNGDFYKKIIRN